MTCVLVVESPRENALSMALRSARNFSLLVVDFLYGTPKRAQLTLYFSFALLVLGAVLQIATHQPGGPLNACAL